MATNNDSTVIIQRLYPVVSNALDKNSKKFLNNIATFMNNRHEEIYAMAPYRRILFNQRDVDNLFNSLGINEKEVANIMKDCYFYNIPINPGCVKEPYIEVLMCCMRYYISKKEAKNALFTTIYFCFTGKIYASLHTAFWKYPPKEEIMDYVINNMLTDKFDLKREGSIFKCMSKLSDTWITTYSNKLCDPKLTDDGMKGLIQQLRDRVKSFLNNIATLYYEAAENKNYMNYETDSLEDDTFRLTSNDSATAARITAAATSIMYSQKIDLNTCEMCMMGISTFKAPELCEILEAIVGNRNSTISEMKRVINIIICDFMANPENKGKKVGGADFIKYSVKAKPNTKSKILIELKNTITNWLMNYSTKYPQRNRQATRNDYYRAVLMYLVYTICKVA